MSSLNSNNPSQQVHIVTECPVCAGREFTPVTKPGHPIGSPVFGETLSFFGVSRCRCGLLFVTPRPATGLLRTFYSGTTYCCHSLDLSSERTRKANALLDIIEFNHQKPSGRLLDFGCGGGYFVRHAINRGWNALGLDVGQEALKTCSAHGIPAVDTLTASDEGQFDVIVLNHVFEHIEDPGALLEILKAYFTPTGLLLIEVPNVTSLRARLSFPFLTRLLDFDERYRAYPIHLWYFSPHTLGRLLTKHGYKKSQVTTQGIGLDELFATETPTSCEARQIKGRDQALKSRNAFMSYLKRLVKYGIYHSHLGENLIIAAHVDRPVL